MVVDTTPAPPPRACVRRQAQKFAGTKHEDLIRKARSPGEAARMGRDRARPLRTDWARVKEDVMLVALRAKFRQNRHLQAVLLSTRDAKLSEHTHKDRYWGTCWQTSTPHHKRACTPNACPQSHRLTSHSRTDDAHSGQVTAGTGLAVISWASC